MLHLNETDRIRIKRAYEDRSPGDGRWILVDRLWPRGVSKAELRDTVWMKDVAPSAQLRKWFGHKPERWEAFRARYIGELQRNPALAALRELVATGPVTLVYSARDEARNQAVVLAEFLRGEAATGEHTSGARAGKAAPPAPGPKPRGARP